MLSQVPALKQGAATAGGGGPPPPATTGCVHTHAAPVVVAGSVAGNTEQSVIAIHVASSVETPSEQLVDVVAGGGGLVVSALELHVPSS